MMPKSSAGAWQSLPPISGHDPEGRLVPELPECIRDKMLDKTIADTFPTSDPPSSLPDPCAEDSFATEEERRLERELCSGMKSPPKAA
jgi:hypothetical protein